MIFIANKGPVYTPHGENETLIQMKALAFRDTYQEFLQNNDISKLVQPKDVDEVAWSEVLDLYKHKDRMRWLKLFIKTYKIDLRFCTEDDVRDVLVKYIFMRNGVETGKEITSKKTISDICTNVRMMFRNIGREYNWEHNKKFTLFKTDLICSGNPMTTGTERLLKDKLSKKDVVKKGEKLAGAVSMPMAYIFLTWLLSRLVNDIRRWESGKITQKERIVNLAYLTLLWAFSMHEGPRYSEIVDYLKYDKLYIPLHKKIYWLSLVFMNKDTLKHVLLHNHIPYYVMSLYKSKKMRVDRPRMKAVIPAAYNSIDLLTIFVFCMRCIMTIDFEGQMYTSLQVFKKKNYSDLRKERVKSIRIRNMTFYSCRYGAAVDDIKARTEVKESWTRYRMGHTPTSQMKDKYGSNKDRVIINEDEIAKMGLDVFDGASYENNKGITLEFLPMDVHGCSYDNSWIDTVFRDCENSNAMREDFELTSQYVSNFIEATDFVEKEAYKNIIAKKFEYKCGDFSWMSEFPMGFYINFPNELVTPGMKKLFDESLDTLCCSTSSIRIFEVDPPIISPELWSFPQVIYGNWRCLIKSSETGFQKPPLVRIPNTHIQSRKRPRLCDDTPNIPKENVTQQTLICIQDIKVGDLIAIYTEDCDDYTYSLDSVDTVGVWYMKIEKLKIIKNEAYTRGRFYKSMDGSLFQIDKRPYKNEVIIPQTSLVGIYSNISDMFLITDKQKDDIRMYMKTE